jgi:hypothetical protein
MGYVEEVVAIYVLNYGGISKPVILMKSQWMQPKWEGKRQTMIKDSDGLLLANFNTASATLSDPFIFPSQVEQAFFLGVEEMLGWRVVCHRKPRQRRIIGTKMVFFLNDHGLRSSTNCQRRSDRSGCRLYSNIFSRSLE